MTGPIVYSYRNATCACWMRSVLRPALRSAMWCVVALAVAGHGQTWGQGFVYPGVGPVNRSMAGAAVASPLDAAGALHWNPAAISGLSGSELVVGMELHMPQSRLVASSPADAFSPGSPALSDALGSHTGAVLLPSFAWVHQPADSLWTYGLGVSSAGGFDVNYEAAASHPITSTDGYGLGALSSRFNILQVTPTLSRQITDSVAIGFAPVLSIAELGFSRGLFAAPDDANGDGQLTYPSASFSPVRYGMGFQLGVYATTPSRWHLGASYKSKHWIEDFVYLTTDETGASRAAELRVEHPSIVSVGAAYSGLRHWLFAVDVRYIRFSATDFFGDEAQFRPDGSLQGLGWRDSTGTALGCQYIWSNSMSMRVGYGYGQSPLSDRGTSVNVQTGEFWNHMLTMGVTMHMSTVMSLNVAYVRTFDNSNAGPIDTAAGIVAGSEVSIGQRADAIISGISLQF